MIQKKAWPAWIETEELISELCAPGYQGRKRGEVVRTRTVILQAHTHQLLGTFGGPGNGDYRGELRQAIRVETSETEWLLALRRPDLAPRHSRGKLVATFRQLPFPEWSATG